MSYHKRVKRTFSLRRTPHHPLPDRSDTVIRDFFAALDCPRALTCWILFKENEHDQLANLECDPRLYLTTADVRSAYAATSYLSKYDSLNCTFDKQAVALTKFKTAEDKCASTNRRFRDLGRDTLFKGVTVRLHNAVVRKVASILGVFPKVEDFFDLADWGPGASTLLPARRANVANKFLLEVGITPELYSVLVPGGSMKILSSFSPRWASCLVASGFPLFFEGNKVITVPKNSKTDRVIAIEPGINLWFQKAVGSMIRGKLRRCGIDLNSQERNQFLARVASKTGHLATIDFSSASDTISTEVVRELLPPSWFRWLDLFRSSRGKINDESFRWNKFSSMGNGFTFELESLIFYAVACCCAEDMGISSDEVSVYGDDVIIPSACVDSFVRMSTFYGFTINTQKSFSDGYFRESCGSYYMNDVDVKPIFLKQKISTIHSIYKSANSIRRLAHRWGFLHCCDKAFESLFCKHLSWVPNSLRFRIPEDMGDGGFISNFDEACPSRAPGQLEGHEFTQFSEKGVTLQVDHDGLLLARLWVPSTELALRNEVTIRGRTFLRVERHVLVRQWYNLGEWL